MKITSVQFVFDNGAVVTFIKNLRGYTVKIENKNGSSYKSTLASPSQILAKTFLTNSLKTEVA